MEEILLNYQGIIGAIAGTVLGTVTTLITTHILRNHGKVQTSIFDVEYKKIEKDSFNPYNMIRLDFKVKFYNMSESNKVLDDVELIFLNDKNTELLSVAPDDRDTFRSSQYSAYIDKLYFVNLSPKQLALKKLQIEVTDEDLEDLESIRVVKLKCINNKRKKKYDVYKR
ncbi:hypothetical protein SPD48_15380 [Pseudogracilibacillus sp. SE30717A]|uniref:hypothetical protein n=1 Tax=Pseudogracilibacillus sp. SE30717A TaxID=3098293 RepID=UPI00300E4B31